jgi:uncharacterized protein (DUF2147 family)
MPAYVRFQSLQGGRVGKLLLAIAVLLGGFQHVAFAASPVGLWYAEGGAAEVEIRPCSDGLCGRVVWLRSPIGDDGCELRDDKNPDPGARGKTIIGLVVLHGLKQLDAEGRQWVGGTIYDPVSARTYACNARLDGDDRLFLRGFWGIQLLGRTTTWTRVGVEKRQCES